LPAEQSIAGARFRPADPPLIADGLPKLKRFCPPSFHYGATAFGAFRTLRPGRAAGLPGRKKIRQGIPPDFRRLMSFDELSHNHVSRMRNRKTDQLRIIMQRGFGPASSAGADFAAAVFPFGFALTAPPLIADGLPRRNLGGAEMKTDEL